MHDKDNPILQFLAQQKLAKEKLAAERRVKRKLARERLAREKIAKAELAKEIRAQRKLEKEKLAQQEVLKKEAAAKLAREKRVQRKLEQQEHARQEALRKAEEAKLSREKRSQRKLEQQEHARQEALRKEAAARLLQEKRAQQKLEKERLAKEKQAQHALEQEQLTEQAVLRKEAAARLAQEKHEQRKLEQQERALQAVIKKEAALQKKLINAGKNQNTKAISKNVGSKDKLDPVDEGRREFLCLTTGAVGLLGAATVLWPLVDSMNPSEDAVAEATVDVDLSKIAVGESLTVVWQGKPIFIRHRTPKEIEEAQSASLKSLKDPEPDSKRVEKPEWLVVIGVCTHLGCIPLGQKATDPRGEYGGWLCPCHGSQFDTAGRVCKGPAPTNLEIPPYRFLNNHTLQIGTSG